MKWTTLRVGHPVRLTLEPYERVSLEPHPGLEKGGVWVIDKDPPAGHVWLVQEAKLDKALLVTVTITVDGKARLHDVMLEGEDGVGC